jgi:hypothetical protein
MRRLPIPAIVPLLTAALLALGLLAAGTANATHPKGDPRLQVVHAFTSAETAGAIATATVSCPQTTRPDLGPWRAISGGFNMTTGQPGFIPGEGSIITPFGSGVVYESQKVGQRSWRVSAQSLWGRFDLGVSVYCQNGVPKTKSASSTVVTPGTPQVGPATVARCRSSKAVAGGFSTPPPFTPTGAANTVIGSIPSGTAGWQAQALSSQASSLTSYVYCAKRKPPALGRSFVGESDSVATLDQHLVNANTYDPGCPREGRFIPGGGGFSEQGATSSQYLIPKDSNQQSGGTVWHVDAIKVGSGIPVTLKAVLLCG